MDTTWPVLGAIVVLPHLPFNFVRVRSLARVMASALVTPPTAAHAPAAGPALIAL